MANRSQDHHTPSRRIGKGIPYSQTGRIQTIQQVRQLLEEYRTTVSCEGICAGRTFCRSLFGTIKGEAAGAFFKTLIE